ncbi:MAG: hypothetical protein M1608_12960, partial [Candidatus Omnitrophica bacterium]|nr:hypothetical protein [Candidatus Omnitrophota bacterium]
DMGPSTGDFVGLTFMAGEIGAWTAARYFPGSIDEFALYSTNLSPAQVLRHYAAAVPPVEIATLSFSQSGTQLTLSWTASGFVLQENTSLTNPAGWTDVSGGSTSPVAVNLGSGAKFYRLKK